MEHSHKTWVTAIVALVVGLAAGWGITMAMDNKTTANQDHSEMQVKTSDKASDLRASLVALGVEHMVYTDRAVADALDGAPGAEASAAALYQNGKDIGAAVGSVYGKEAEDTFNQVWKLHLDQFVNYAVAASKGDDAGKTAALNTIDEKYTKPLAAYLANANPNLPQDVLESSLREHVNMTAQMIDYHVAGDYTKEAEELEKAGKHIEGIMTTLAVGIVQQFPDKF